MPTLTLTHCPDGERLFKAMQTDDSETAWLVYHQHRETCEICGMKE
jgi:hypothetical protein